MFEEIKRLVITNYAIPPVGHISSVKAGFLSHNFVLETAEQKYFFKQYRFTNIGKVKAAHEAKFFFADAGVPVILPLTHKAGETILESEGRFYSLFPFVHGHQHRRGHMSQRSLESMARMQGWIHRAGANMKSSYVRRSNASKSYQEFVETAQLILSKIPDAGRTEFDEKAQETIRLRLHLAQQNREAIEQIQMGSDHWVHGDYQEANVFFDDRDEVSHVFDWESTKIAPRGLSLVRAIALVCFGQVGTYIAEHSAENFSKARQFLAAYNEAYPIPRNEFLQAATVRYLHKMMSLWIETAHYLEDNSRVDIFLQADEQVLQYYAVHFDEYVERICDGIL